MNRWTVADQIDMEFFQMQDDSVPESMLEKRDREIFLKSVQPVIHNTSASPGLFRRKAIRIWLDQRRNSYEKESNNGSVLPGDIFTDAYRVFCLVIAVAGIVSGAGLALSMLVYDGVEPVNVSVCFSVLVLMQVCLIIFTLRFLFTGNSLERLKRYSVVYPLMSSVAQRMVASLVRSAVKRFPREKQQLVESVFKAIMTRQSLYGRVVFWTLFILMQLFGIMFNIGAIIATLVRVFAADLAFGWQSTIQVSSQAVYTLVRILAVPWSWIIPAGSAYPGLEQIEGSRMVLKEGIYHLATGNLVSWWPFLICAVCVYALLPRIVLFSAGRFAQGITLARAGLLSSRTERIIMRMTMQVMSTAGAVQDSRQSMVENDGETALKENVPGEQGLPSIVLMPSDLGSGYEPAKLSEVVGRRLGWKVLDVLAIRGERVSDAKVLNKVSDAVAEDRTGIVVVQEAWQPPIIEMTEFVRYLRLRAGPDTPITVLLVGKPGEHTVFTGVDIADKEVWARSLGKLGDPYLRLEAVEDTG